MALDLRSNFKTRATLVADEFIDQYMVSANGEYVKVYLYLLRHEEEEYTVSMIADALNHTEADVKRALTYWEKMGVLQKNAGQVSASRTSDSASLSSSSLESAQVSAARESSRPSELASGSSPAQPAVVMPAPKTRPIYTPSQITGLAENGDFSQLLYIAQKYLNKVFTPRDCEVFAYLYDSLGMKAELLEYLVEYCVQGGHTNIRYIETVALSWHEKGLTTLDKAKTQAASFTKDIFAVMKAFGLSDRKPGDMEQEMIDRWFRNYGFSRTLVLEACNRTLEATHSPSFKYADKILSDWKAAGVKALEDVKALDDKRRDGKTRQTSSKNEGSPARAASSRNQFHNFSQRDTDYDALILQQLREQ